MLTKTIKAVKTKQKKATTVKNKVAFVLDRSGSMAGLTDTVIKTTNSWLSKVRSETNEKDQETTITRVHFDDTVDTYENNVDVNLVKPLRSFSLGGSTALFDAVTETVENLENYEDDDNTSLLVIVITDGGENASTPANRQNIGRLLAQKQKKKNWTFVFMLPPGSKNNFVRTYGIPTENVVEWEASERGLREVEQKTSAGLTSYFDSRSRGLRQVDTFYVNTDLSGVRPTQLKRQLDDVSSDCRVIEVKQEEVIQPFVEQKTRRTYIKGSTYYQLMKKELVQSSKEVLIMEKGKTAIYAGDQARNLIGLPIGADAKVTPGNHSNYDIYVQSTSANRKLPRGTKIIVRS